MILLERSPRGRLGHEGRRDLVRLDTGHVLPQTARIQETRVKRAPRQPLVLDIPENYPGALSDIY